MLAQALVDSGCDGRVATFELNPENADIAGKNVKAAGLDEHVKLQVGDRRQLIEAALQNEIDLHFAFIGASHFYDEVTVEFELISPKPAPDALVLFDNSYRTEEDGKDPRVKALSGRS
ncbi:O-methyltransferase [Methylocaldum marinum]|uniref:O-methyltransferase n=1 Tax=Methylocaldum marinum TaxID=1432792 RepID=A0A250KUA6_9GAMM|nr:O-methyltransferase [Methylocaldum marinum]